MFVLIYHSFTLSRAWQENKEVGLVSPKSCFIKHELTKYYVGPVISSWLGPYPFGQMESLNLCIRPNTGQVYWRLLLYSPTFLVSFYSRGLVSTIFNPFGSISIYIRTLNIVHTHTSSNLK